MGKKLDALLGKTFKTSKFKSLANLAVSRIAYLEKKHKVQSFQARSDVVQLLSVGQQEHALLRVMTPQDHDSLSLTFSCFLNLFFSPG